MCVGSLMPKPKPPAPLPEDASVLEQRKRQRAEQQRQLTEDKQLQFEQRIAAFTGKQGKRSLMSGRTGGQGFKLDKTLMTRDTLGY
jgi:hypothetical protein